MSKGKSEDTSNPFKNFNLIQGGFGDNESTTNEEDDIVTGDPAVIDEEIDEEAKKRQELADKALEEIAKKQASKTKAKEVDTTVSTDITDDKSDKENTDEDSVYKLFVRGLAEKGIIDFDDTDEDFEDSEEGIYKLNSKTIKNRIDKWANSLNPDYVKFLEYTNAGGDPKTFLQVYYGNHSWESFKIDSKDNQKAVIQENLRLQDYTDEEISEVLEEYTDNGTLEKHAKIALPKLQKYEISEKESLVKKQREAEEAKVRSDKEYWESFKKDLYGKEDIKGFKLTPKLKDRIWETLTVVNKRTGKTAYQEAVEGDKDTLLLFALQASQGFDLTKLEKQVVSKVSKSLGKMLKNMDKTSRDKISAGGDKDNDEVNPFSGFRTVG